MKKLLLFLCMTVTFYGHSQTLRAMPDTFTVFQANIDTFYVTTVDSIPVGDSVCISLIDTGARFSVLACHAIVYHPDSAFIGRDTCRYALCDTSGICDTTMVVIYVDTNVGLLPVASFKDDSLSGPYANILFVCRSDWGLGTYQLSSISQQVDSLSWRVRTSESFSYSPLIFDSTHFYSGDTITFVPSQLGVRWNVFYVEVCLTGYNQYGNSTKCDTSCALAYEGIIEVPLSNIKIYPSPADKTLTIDMSQNTNPISSNYAAINLYNSLGQRVRSIPHQGNNKVIEISVADLPDDIYISTIIDKTGQEDVLGKFVVER